MLNAVILKERTKDVTWKGSGQTFMVGRRNAGLLGSCWLQWSEKTSVESRAQGRQGEGRWKKGRHLGWEFPGFWGKQGLKGDTVGEPHPTPPYVPKGKAGPELAVGAFQSTTTLYLIPPVEAQETASWGRLAPITAVPPTVLNHDCFALF